MITYAGVLSEKWKGLLCQRDFFGTCKICILENKEKYFSTFVLLQLVLISALFAPKTADIRNCTSWTSAHLLQSVMGTIMTHNINRFWTFETIFNLTSNKIWAVTYELGFSLGCGFAVNLKHQIKTIPKAISFQPSRGALVKGAEG